MSFDITKHKHGVGITVKDLITALYNLDRDYKVYICGDENVHIHVSTDEKYITIDNENLVDSYDSLDDVLNRVSISHNSNSINDNEVHIKNNFRDNNSRSTNTNSSNFK
jgi:hypothetical protein